MNFKLDPQNVINANTQFWEQMLAMRLEALAVSEDLCVETGHMYGFVHLTGVWDGRIEVRMTGTLAYEATAAMMMQPLDTVAEADVLDATKEIANMLAGTIKSSLPRPCAMTVPESSMAPDLFSCAEVGEDSMVVAFHHPAGNLLVRILEQQYSPEMAAV